MSEIHIAYKKNVDQHIRNHFDLKPLITFFKTQSFLIILVILSNFFDRILSSPRFILFINNTSYSLSLLESKAL